jgi:hypothetical protein
MSISFGIIGHMKIYPDILSTTPQNGILINSIKNNTDKFHVYYNTPG